MSFGSVALTDPPIIGLAALMLARRWRAKFVLLCQDVFPEVARLLAEGQDPNATYRVRRGMVRDYQVQMTPMAAAIEAILGTVRERFGIADGAEITIELKNEDYGSRGYSARDPEGNHWSFGTYRPGSDWK